MNQLVEEGNTVLMVEHHLDVLKCADWVIDLGPGAGNPAAASWPKEHRKKSPTIENPSRDTI